MSRPGGLVGLAGAPSCCVFYVPTRHGKPPAVQALAVEESLCVFSTRQTAGPTGTQRQDAAPTTPGREVIRTPVRNSAADGGRLAASEKPHRLGYTVRTPGALANPVGHGGTGAAGATPRDWRSRRHTARVVQPVAHGPIGTTSGTRREATSPPAASTLPGPHSFSAARSEDDFGCARSKRTAAATLRPPAAVWPTT